MPAQPRDRLGRFGATAFTEAPLQLAIDPHAHRRRAAAEVLEEYADLEILDHSPARRETVTLAELSDARLALGNCWAVTNELIDQAGPGPFGAARVEEITIRRRRIGGHHVALLASDQGGTYVIDYTARQFNPELPFPLVTDVEDWMATVTRTSGTAWEINHS